MDAFFTAENLVALLALTSLEIVLGIDNIVFLAILVERLDPKQQARARKVGLMLAMVFRILLLLGISWIMHLTHPLFWVASVEVSGKSLILLGGGLFLIAKATWEIHHSFEPADSTVAVKRAASFWGAMFQIVLIDMVFSLDSIITAVGLARHLAVMIIAIVIAVLIMLVFARVIGHFISRHPTLKMLALSFLILVGVMLVADGIGRHIERGYVYFAMAFSLFVETLNIRAAHRAAKKA